MDISNISVVLGVLGAYFAVLLVLSVSVETLLEPISSLSIFKGLQKTVSPDDVLKDVQEWLPEGSDDAAKVIAIQAYAEKAKIDLVELEANAKSVAGTAVKTLSEMGYDPQMDTIHQEVAIKFSALKAKYAASKKQRITILRTLSAVVGLVIAFALQLNSFDILGDLFSPDVQATLSTPVGRFGGIFMTGLAASAGSSFWHDMIGRARNIKDTIKQVENLTGKK
jgi:hypothetical protein